jgi:hypothetical protein
MSLEEHLAEVCHDVRQGTEAGAVLTEWGPSRPSLPGGTPWRNASWRCGCWRHIIRVQQTVSKIGVNRPL